MSLAEDLKRIALAAVSEEGRTQRWLADETVSADMDELAAKRRERAEVDRYPTRTDWEAAALEDDTDRIGF